MNSPKRPFILGPIPDLCLVIFLPALSLLFLSSFLKNMIPNIRYGLDVSHQFSTVFRSHFNSRIFSRFPKSLILVPLLMFSAFLLSEKIYSIGLLVRYGMDPYHSCMQTFGLARVYDKKWGNDPTRGRIPDLCFIFLLFFLPMTNYFLPRWLPLNSYKSQLNTFLLSANVINIMLYGHYCLREFARKKTRPCWPKIGLLLSMVLVSFTIWGFSDFTSVVQILAIYHPVQYLVILWVSERGQLTHKLLSHFPNQTFRSAFPLFFLFLVATGCLITFDNRFIPPLFLTMALTHFWCDGFIWSVRKENFA